MPNLPIMPKTPDYLHGDPSPQRELAAYYHALVESVRAELGAWTDENLVGQPIPPSISGQIAFRTRVIRGIREILANHAMQGKIEMGPDFSKIDVQITGPPQVVEGWQDHRIEQLSDELAEALAEARS